MEKEKREEKIVVVADTTTMKYWSGDSHPAAILAYQRAFRLRPHLLKLMAAHFDKHIKRMSLRDQGLHSREQDRARGNPA